MSPRGEISVSDGSGEKSLTLKPYAEIKEARRRVKAGGEKMCFFHSDLNIQPVQHTSAADGTSREGQSNCPIPGN